MNVGVDIVCNKRIPISENFLLRVLHPRELKVFHKFEDHERAIAFLAGRWAAKEALFKAIGWDFLIFSAILIEMNTKNQPEASFDMEKINHIMVRTKKTEFDWLQTKTQIKLSISHEKHYTIACVVIL